MAHPLLSNRAIAIATMHGKEKVIGPILERSLNATPVVPDAINTDSFGTFSGEVERPDDPIAVARKKCLVAMQLTGLDMALSNEGSFGAHPMIPFIHADTEIVYLIDAKNKIELHTHLISTSTNFNGQTIKSKPELVDFAKEALFPSHGLIIRKSKDSFEGMEKGIRNWDQLISAFDKLINDNESVYIETDMRAMHNPSRQKVIGDTTLKLCELIGKHCPACGMPGYDIIDSEAGLPCGLCNMPTSGIKAYRYGCKYCNHQSIVEYPSGKKVQDPMYCNFCNP